MTRRAWALLAVAIALAVIACWPTDPVVGFAAPAAWRTLFSEVEACSGLYRDFDAIVWSVREEPIRLAGGRFTVGHFDPPDRIWIAREWLADRGTIKHEELHYLIGRPGHPVPPFNFCTEGW